MSNDTKHTPALPHTPTPWRYEASGAKIRPFIIVAAPEGQPGYNPASCTKEGDADLICRAVNTYADLSRRHAEAVRALAETVRVLKAANIAGRSMFACDAVKTAEAVISGNPLPADPVREMVAALEDVKEFLEGRADAEYHPGIERAYPNAEMVLLNTVDNALAGAKRVKL